MKILTALFATLTLFAGQVRANTFTLDLSDMWWTPTESGWGVNVNQQSDILFLTFFVYDKDGSAIWYVAPNVAYVSGLDSNLQFSGSLYRVSGSWLGATFDATKTNAQPVGSVTFSTNNEATATLTYSVDALTISKSVTRQTWRVNNLSGAYLGAVSYGQIDCLSPGPFGPSTLPSELVVTHQDGSFKMTTTDSLQICNYTGTYLQQGRLGSASGFFSCNNGNKGNFAASELEGSRVGISGRLTQIVQACSIDAKFAAVSH